MSSYLKANRIVLTAALPYANGDLHMGHLVEHLQVDIWSRFLRMIGKTCYTFCGDDTHGIPVMLSAQQSGISCEEFIFRTQNSHQEDLQGFSIEYTHYSNTNTFLNKVLCEDIFAQLQKGDSLLEKDIQQYYCNFCSVFLPDRMILGGCPRCEAVGQHGDLCNQCFSTYDVVDLKNPTCARCGISPETKVTSHLFFSLERHRSLLQNWLPQYVDPSVYKKLLEWINGPLRDWDITRDAPYFGFVIPGRENQYFYVWLDAPIGYLSCIQEWQQKVNSVESLKEFWNDQDTSIIHFVGKDIVYFHAIFWPCLLQESSMYRKPDKLFVHGFLTVNGEKMSKSKGNYISLKNCLKYLDPMQVRYYITSQMQPGQEDVDFQIEEFQRRVDSELVGKITNIISRCSALLHRYFYGNLSSLSNEDLESDELYIFAKKIVGKVYHFYLNRDFSAVLRQIRTFAEEVNKFFDTTQPWKQVQTNPLDTQRNLTICLWSFRQIVILLTPVLPEYSKQVSKWLGEDEYVWSSLETWSCKKIDVYQHLTKRVDISELHKIFVAGF